MPIYEMNWKNGTLEECVDSMLKRGQIVVGFFGPSGHSDGIILSQNPTDWGINYRVLWLDDLHVSTSQHIKSVEEKFGCGVYFKPNKFMEEAEILELENKFQEKQAIENAKQTEINLNNERFTAIGKELFEKAIQKHGKPKAIILAVKNEDLSDSQSDYFSFHAVQTIVLAFSKHNRNLFSEMRKAALNCNIPEVRNLATAPKNWEHRENYTGGHGYYLAKSKYYGWTIEKVELYDEKSIEKYYCNAGKTDGFQVK